MTIAHNPASPRPVPAGPAVQRQIVLPTSKAAEIAWKSIRLRLGRSLLVTSGIVLALAFLMAVLSSDAVTDAMRAWVQHGPASEAARRQQLHATLAARGVPMAARDVADARLQARWLVGLALLVAFVGILNATLMSVTERFREIGTMKCLGALDSFIVKLFLIESLFQGLAGAVAGVALGLVLSLASLLASYGSAVWSNLPLARLLAAGAACVAVGVGLTVAGALYPAWQAARMQPIEAMRSEA